jgi:hypothetical protein
MQFAKIATAVALAMGITTFAVAQERMPPSAAPSAPSAQPGMGPGSSDMNSGATGGDTRAGTGSTQGAQINEKNITPLLQAHGYTDVKGVKQSGDMITADAKRDGKSVKLNIDTKTGMVKESRG